MFDNQHNTTWLSVKWYRNLMWSLSARYTMWPVDALRYAAKCSDLGRVVPGGTIFVRANSNWHEYVPSLRLNLQYIAAQAIFGLASAISSVSISKLTAFSETTARLNRICPILEIVSKFSFPMNKISHK